MKYIGQTVEYDEERAYELERAGFVTVIDGNSQSQIEEPEKQEIPVVEPEKTETGHIPKKETETVPKKKPGRKHNK